MQVGYAEFRVIDAHIHFFSHQFFDAFLRRRSRQFPEQDPQSLPQQLGWEVPPAEPAALTGRWVEELDRHGVARTVLPGGMLDDEACVARAVQAFPDWFIGFMPHPSRNRDLVGEEDSANRSACSLEQGA